MIKSGLHYYCLLEHKAAVRTSARGVHVEGVAQDTSTPCRELVCSLLVSRPTVLVPDRRPSAWVYRHLPSRI